MSKLTVQELASVAAQLDAEETQVRAAVGSSDSPMAPMAQLEPRDEGDLADEEVRRRQGDAMRDHYRMRLVDIAAARARMQHGEYGTCVDCGGGHPILTPAGIPDRQALYRLPEAARESVCATGGARISGRVISDLRLRSGTAVG